MNYKIKPITGRGKPQVVHVDRLKRYIPRQAYPEWKESDELQKGSEDEKVDHDLKSKRICLENDTEESSDSDSSSTETKQGPQRGRPRRVPDPAALTPYPAPGTSFASRSPWSGYFLHSKSRVDC